MKILITGGAGYVGSKLVPILIENGHEVTVLDLMMYGENVLNKNPNLTSFKGDILSIVNFNPTKIYFPINDKQVQKLQKSNQFKC